jgi:hypothetical protein
MTIRAGAVRLWMTRPLTAGAGTVPPWSAVKKRESWEFALLSPNRNRRPFGTFTSYALRAPSASPSFTYGS